MRTKFILTALVLIAITISSCDFAESSTFTITNQSPYDITILTSHDKYDKGFVFDDSIHIIKTGEKKSFIQQMGLCVMNYYPSDYYNPNDTIPRTSKFKILIHKKSYDALRIRALWKFSCEKYMGNYDLIVDKELVDSIETTMQ